MHATMPREWPFSCQQHVEIHAGNHHLWGAGMHAIAMQVCCLVNCAHEPGKGSRATLMRVKSEEMKGLGSGRCRPSGAAASRQLSSQAAGMASWLYSVPYQGSVSLVSPCSAKKTRPRCAQNASLADDSACRHCVCKNRAHEYQMCGTDAAVTGQKAHVCETRAP